jgi:hypothetical protein
VFQGSVHSFGAFFNGWIAFLHQSDACISEFELLEKGLLEPMKNALTSVYLQLTIHPALQSHILKMWKNVSCSEKELTWWISQLLEQNLQYFALCKYWRFYYPSLDSTNIYSLIHIDQQQHHLCSQQHDFKAGQFNQLENIVEQFLPETKMRKDNWNDVIMNIVSILLLLIAKNIEKLQQINIWILIGLG